ncbi:NAD(P)-dependent alcohol dehydrogenase [Actinoplanes sp. NBC_00393]|uniref:NAD(P)-dependent alcohol dehydrogenase n=1 Tax=Actinoplanes sp. NBC_00393 TaxID=2975953 RepID=UPI002E1FFC3E
MRAVAALVESPGGPFTLRDVEIEPPRPDEILVRITAAGICHTDLIMRRNWPLLPMVFGHEGAGVVEAVGSQVTSVVPGDAVCLSFRSCGECAQCRGGAPAYCLRSALNSRGARADGSSPLSRDGGVVYGNFFGQSSFATYAVAYESNTVKIPADLSPVLAAPLGCSVQTGAGTVLNVFDPAPGATVLVLGAGSVGLCAVMAAVARGCTVIAIDPVEARRDLATSFGASSALPSLPNSGRADFAIDTTGRPDVIDRALRSLQRQGTLALVGIGAKAEIDIMTVMTNGLRIRGVIEGDAVPTSLIPQLIDLQLPLDKIITEYPFTEIETAARDAFAGRVVKPVLRVS